VPAGLGVAAGLAANGGPYCHGPVMATVGYTAVALFFVLSGFLITSILLRAKGRPGYYRNFYARRALRILPLYYAVLLARVALAHAGGPWPPLVVPAWVAHAVFTGNLWQCYARWAGLSFDSGGLHVGWSLAVEEHFSLVWPAVVAATSGAGLWRVCGAGGVAALLLRLGLPAAGCDPWFTYALAPCRLDALLLGGAVALAATSGVPP
jgi:peptidoglycan/LPS O-acetylase OafA/YrhL